MNKPVLLMDLDGCLVDFVHGALAAHNATLPISEVKWDFCSQIGFAGIHDPAFYAPFNESFWANLDCTEECWPLLRGVEELFGENVAIMTSPCETDGAVEGKVQWIRKNLPDYSRRFFIGSSKYLAAGPGKILLDDYDGNVQLFRQAGGRAVLAPRPWNSGKGLCDGQGGFSVEAVLLALKLERDLAARECEERWQ